MPHLKCIFPHSRAGKSFEVGSYVEVEDMEKAEQFLKVDPELGVVLFVLETQAPMAVSPQVDPFEEIRKMFDLKVKEDSEKAVFLGSPLVEKAPEPEIVEELPKVEQVPEEKVEEAPKEEVKEENSETLADPENAPRKKGLKKE